MYCPEAKGGGPDGLAESKALSASNIVEKNCVLYHYSTFRLSLAFDQPILTGIGCRCLQRDSDEGTQISSLTLDAAADVFNSIPSSTYIL
jgi:hypothetical protein